MKPFSLDFLSEGSVVTTRLGTRCRILDVTPDNILVALENGQLQSYNKNGRLNTDRDCSMDLVIQ